MEETTHGYGLVQNAQHQAEVNLGSAKHYEEAVVQMHVAGTAERQKVNHESQLLQRARQETQVAEMSARSLRTELHNSGQIVNHERAIAHGVGRRPHQVARD